MASNRRDEAVESFPMIGGDGPHSYAHNSFRQKRAMESAKALIVEGISEKLDSQPFLSPYQRTFSIADLGCSVGPNTFVAVQSIIDSVKLKFQSDGIDSDSVEFHVFFNDHVSNDFNTLFKSIPSGKNYSAAGVPGSFHHRLFPKGSLNFVHSSFALQWLSKVPKEVVDKDSPAWNKGKVYFTKSAKEVADAYARQFGKDIESFLNARAMEVVSGGLMTLLITSHVPPSKCSLIAAFDLLGSALMDLANKGLVDEEKVDAFNLPIYLPTPSEMSSLIESNGLFSVENMDWLAQPLSDVDTTVMHLRASWDNLLTMHFGDGIIDQVSDQLKKKLIESSVHTDPNYKPPYATFLLLKRKSN